MSYGTMFAKPYPAAGVHYIDVQIPHCDVRVFQHDDTDIQFYALNKEDEIIEVGRNGDTIEIRKAGSSQVVRSGIAVSNGRLNISGSIVVGGDLAVNGLRRKKPPRKLTLKLTLLVPSGVKEVYASAENVKISKGE